jgi:hypothetical protein
MHEYPKAYVIPVGAGQRSDPEAGRLVRWLLANGIRVDQVKKDYATARRRSKRVHTSSG